MSRYLKRFLMGTAVAMIILAAAPTARAGLLPVSVNVTPDGDNFRFSYGVVLTSDSELHTGDFFTIYDFAGYVPETHMEPAGFEFSMANIGPTPEGLIPVDSEEVMNLTWTYTGPNAQVGQLGLGNFMAISEFPNTRTGFFTSQTHRQADGQGDNNITSTSIPVPEAPPTVPEPTTLALVGIGLPLVGMARFLRRRR